MLEIKKLGSKNFFHYWNDFTYSGSSYTIIYENCKVFLRSVSSRVIFEKAGYNITDIRVYDLGGSAESFSNFETLQARLISLGYPSYGEYLGAEDETVSTLNNRVSLINTDNKMCVYGIDSLTAGAGGTSFREFFDNKYRGAYNTTSELGYCHLDFATASDLGIGFSKSAGLAYMTNETDFSVSPVKYSISGKGLYGTSMVEDFFTFNANAHFDKIVLYYLQQPSGGTFKYGFSNISTVDYPTVDTDGVLSIQKIELDRQTFHNTVFKVSSINGDCAFFGVWFKISDDSTSVCNIAKGGMELAKIMTLDSASRQYWYSELTPSVVLLNAGTNDREIVNKATFKTYLGNYIDDVQAGSPNTQIVIIEPNRTVDYSTTYAIEYTEARTELVAEKEVDLIDIPTNIGDYAYFVANDLMLDTIHPNEAGNKLIAKLYTNSLGIPNVGSYSVVSDDLFTSGDDDTEFSEVNINPVSLTPLDSGTEYPLYELGFINGYVDFYFELKVYLRYLSSGNMRIKHLKFKASNTTVNGNSTAVTALDVVDGFDSTTTPLPDSTFTLSIISDKMVLTMTPTTNLTSAHVSGTIMSSKVVDSSNVIYYY